MSLILKIIGLARFLHLEGNLINHDFREETGQGGMEVGQQEPGGYDSQNPSWRTSELLNDPQKLNE